MRRQNSSWHSADLSGRPRGVCTHAHRLVTHFSPVTSFSAAMGAAMAAILLGFVGEQLATRSGAAPAAASRGLWRACGRACACACERRPPQRAWHPQRGRRLGVWTYSACGRTRRADALGVRTHSACRRTRRADAVAVIGSVSDLCCFWWFPGSLRTALLRVSSACALEGRWQKGPPSPHTRLSIPEALLAFLRTLPREAGCRRRSLLRGEGFLPTFRPCRRLGKSGGSCGGL